MYLYLNLKLLCQKTCHLSLVVTGTDNALMKYKENPWYYHYWCCDSCVVFHVKQLRGRNWNPTLLYYKQIGKTFLFPIYVLLSYALKVSSIFSCEGGGVGSSEFHISVQIHPLGLRVRKQKGDRCKTLRCNTKLEKVKV